MDEAALDLSALHTVSACGFSATVDAFARNPETQSVFFLSMVGAQTAVKAISAALLKQPPEAIKMSEGDGIETIGVESPWQIPWHTIGTWTTKIARLPLSRGWHMLVYTKHAEYTNEKSQFLLLAPDEANAPELHLRFLDKRSPLPLHKSWAQWMWERGLAEKEITPLESVGLHGYWCQPSTAAIRRNLQGAVKNGLLTVPNEEKEEELCV